MINEILNKLTEQEIIQLSEFFNRPALSQHELNTRKIKTQIEYAVKLLKTNSRAITAKRLMFIWDISKPTAYRRISLALSQHIDSFETKVCNN